MMRIGKESDTANYVRDQVILIQRDNMDVYCDNSDIIFFFLQVNIQMTAAIFCDWVRENSANSKKFLINAKT